MIEEKHSLGVVANKLMNLFIANNWLRLAETPNEEAPFLAIRTRRDDDDHFLYDDHFIYVDKRVDGKPYFDFKVFIDWHSDQKPIRKVEFEANQELTPEQVIEKIEAIMSAMLERALSTQNPGEKKVMPTFQEETEEYRKNEIAKLTNCINDMSVQEMCDWLSQYWGAVFVGGVNFDVKTQRNQTNFHPDLFNTAKELVLGRLGTARIAPPPKEYDEHREEVLVSSLKNLTDKDLSIWFRNMQHGVGSEMFSMPSPTGNGLQFEHQYLGAFGRIIAARLEAPRIDENMLVIELGKERPLNPLVVMKKFQQALEEVIEKGPEEPQVRAHGTQRSISQNWIEWYRKTHSCGFDVAWREGAKRLIHSDYANRPEELKKITWYPNNSNPLQVDTGRKLEFIEL